MNNFTQFPFVRFCIALIVGIVLYNYFTPTNIIGAIATCLCLGLAYVTLFIFRQRFKNQLLVGCTGLLWLCSSGYLLAFLHDEKSYPQHYSHQLQGVSHYEVIVDNLVEEKENSWKVVTEVRALVKSNEILPAKGKILLYLDNHTVDKPNFGDVLLIKGKPQEIASPKNPEEFNYQQYMRWQNIDFQQYCRASMIEKMGNENPDFLKSFAIKSNIVADSIFTTYVEGKQEYGVANAMILGQRDDIDSNLMQAYSAAGAIHVLSVSGLHVGVICGVLMFLLGFLRKWGKNGKILWLVTVLITLWFYAFLTGLSSPVLRSTLMFSVILIAKTFQRKDNSYNTVAFSAFCLLLINPNFIYNVGFQLSYLAVFGMIYFQPKLNPLLIIDKSKSWFHWLADHTWKVTTVAIAAQIATFPITIYYFHQFPNYFIFANPIVILLSSVVLMAGLGFIILAKILLFFQAESIIYFFGQCLKYSILALNKTVLWFENLPFAIAKFLWLSTFQMYVLYLLMFTIIALWRTKAFRWVWISCGLTFTLIVGNVTQYFVQRNQDTLTLFSVPKHSVFNITKGKKAYLIADDSFLKSRKDIGFRMNNYWSKCGITDTLKYDLHSAISVKELAFCQQSKDSISVLMWKNLSFLWLGKNLKNKNLEVPTQTFDYLVLANKSVKDLKQIIGKVQFKHLVIDASYSDWYADKLSEQARNLGIMVTNLRKSGALEVKAI
ncbi:ComEC/Rec2 family competence protein [Arcicella rigui]|uniref:ComEC/Rec2 family competence protein n=1 Tax=Arcicella rigui TaxID=797020 RepID=A0ABU5QBV1_9BACT|nr:ComEC/Rec2 family competence protein [Arcicella rigui]MEA5140326.1 ComEC/Rec2 family competence protein [Arcicella rigui]